MAAAAVQCAAALGQQVPELVLALASVWRQVGASASGQRDQQQLTNPLRGVFYLPVGSVTAATRLTTVSG
jgi:hypothetical protein